MNKRIEQLCSEFDEVAMTYGTLKTRRLWAKRLAELEGENERLRAAFLKYARHKIDCAWLRGTWDALCTCGYNEAAQQTLNAETNADEH